MCAPSSCPARCRRASRPRSCGLVLCIGGKSSLLFPMPLPVLSTTAPNLGFGEGGWIKVRPTLAGGLLRGYAVGFWVLLSLPEEGGKEPQLRMLRPALWRQPQKGPPGVLSQGTSHRATPGATKLSLKCFILGAWPGVLYPAPKPAPWQLRLRSALLRGGPSRCERVRLV